MVLDKNKHKCVTLASINYLLEKVQFCLCVATLVTHSYFITARITMAATHKGINFIGIGMLLPNLFENAWNVCNFGINILFTRIGKLLCDATLVTHSCMIQPSVPTAAAYKELSFI